jgi:hypothetical protein
MTQQDRLRALEQQMRASAKMATPQDHYGEGVIYATSVTDWADELAALLAEDEAREEPKLPQQWMVVRKRGIDQPEAWVFDRYDDAATFWDRAQAQWSDVWFCRVAYGPHGTGMMGERPEVPPLATSRAATAPPYLSLTEAQTQQVQDALEGWEDISFVDDERRRREAFELIQELAGVSLVRQDATEDSADRADRRHGGTP